jgi:hypothetical protein
VVSSASWLGGDDAVLCRQGGRYGHMANGLGWTYAHKLLDLALLQAGLEVALLGCCEAVRRVCQFYCSFGNTEIVRAVPSVHGVDVIVNGGWDGL